MSWVESSCCTFKVEANTQRKGFWAPPAPRSPVNAAGLALPARVYNMACGIPLGAVGPSSGPVPGFRAGTVNGGCCGTAAPREI